MYLCQISDLSIITTSSTPYTDHQHRLGRHQIKIDIIIIDDVIISRQVNAQGQQCTDTMNPLTLNEKVTQLREGSIATDTLWKGSEPWTY